MSKRKFELVEGTSSKFWEIWIEGTEVRTRYGRIGAAGQTTIKDEGDAAKAGKLYEKLIVEKTKKGYVEVDGAMPAARPTSVQLASAGNSASVGSFESGKHAAAIAKITARAAKHGVVLPAGASPAAIADAEKTLGITFPDEVRAFYLTHDGGSSDEDYNCNGRLLLSIGGIVDQWQIWKDLLDGGDFEDNDHGVPDRGVQKKWWIPEWIPITYDGAGNHEVLDLAPAGGGTAGQIVGFWHDDSPRTLDAPDLLSWLQKARWATESGDEDEAGESGEPAWRRFEVDEKFWAIRRDGVSFTVKFGKIGSEGQQKTKDFDDEGAAEKAYDELVLEKTNKGYAEVGSDD